MFAVLRYPLLLLLLSVVLLCRIQAWARDSGFAGFLSVLPFLMYPPPSFCWLCFFNFQCLCVLIVSCCTFWCSTAWLAGCPVLDLLNGLWLIRIFCLFLSLSLSLFAPLFSALRCNCSLELLCCCWTNLWRRSCCCSFSCCCYSVFSVVMLKLCYNFFLFTSVITLTCDVLPPLLLLAAVLMLL